MAANETVLYLAKLPGQQYVLSRSPINGVSFQCNLILYTKHEIEIPTKPLSSIEINAWFNMHRRCGWAFRQLSLEASELKTSVNTNVA